MAASIGQLVEVEISQAGRSSSPGSNTTRKDDRSVTELEVGGAPSA
ncbi:hypothetical protein [Lacisediminihabitans sp. H27-G8]